MDKQNTAIAVRYNKDFAVIQANELVRGKQEELTLLEAKLVRLAITQVLKDDTDLKTYSCNVADLARYLGISKGNIYRDVKNLAQSLMRKSIMIRDRTTESRSGKENYKLFHWVDYIEYQDGTITFRLSESLKPYLIGLDQLFTMYSYESVIDLPTNYSIRLYELLVSYQNRPFREDTEAAYGGFKIGRNECVFSVEWLRDYFNCLDKYPNTGDFVRRVIESAVNAIRDKTLMGVRYRTVKQGRTITHIVFTLDSWSGTKEE